MLVELDRVTGELNPLIDVTLMVVDAEEPILLVRLLTVAERE
jgi:hypothetical protein